MLAYGDGSIPYGHLLDQDKRATLANAIVLTMPDRIRIRIRYSRVILTISAVETLTQ